MKPHRVTDLANITFRGFGPFRALINEVLL